MISFTHGYAFTIGTFIREPIITAEATVSKNTASSVSQDHAGLYPGCAKSPFFTADYKGSIAFHLLLSL